MRKLPLYDTYTRRLREFKPLHPAEPGNTAQDVGQLVSDGDTGEDKMEN